METQFNVYYHMRNGDIFGQDNVDEADIPSYVERFKNHTSVFFGNRGHQETYSECYFRSSDVLYLEFCEKKENNNEEKES